MGHGRPEAEATVAKVSESAAEKAKPARYDLSATRASSEARSTEGMVKRANRSYSGAP